MPSPVSLISPTHTYIQEHTGTHRSTQEHTSTHTGTYKHMQGHTQVHRHTTDIHRHTYKHTRTHNEHTSTRIQAHTHSHTCTHKHTGIGKLQEIRDDVAFFPSRPRLSYLSPCCKRKGTWYLGNTLLTWYSLRLLEGVGCCCLFF